MSLALAFITFLPLVIVVALTTLTLFNRDIRSATLLCGLVINALFNNLLKRIIRQPRPQTSALAHSSGMPSNHGQFQAFFAMWLTLFMIHRAVPNRNFLLPLLWVMSLIVCFSRYHLGVHTIEQIVVGAVIGSIFAVVWFHYDRQISGNIMRLPRATVFLDRPKTV